MYGFCTSGFSYFGRYIASLIFGNKENLYRFASINFVILSPHKQGDYVTEGCYHDRDLAQQHPFGSQKNTRYTESCKWLKKHFRSKLTHAEGNNAVENCCSTPENEEYVLTEAAKERIEQEINTYNVVLFMKGSAKQPQCKFSRQALDILKASKVKVIRTVNILEDKELRQGLKKYSNYPNFPQLYVRGKFVGGLQKISEMFENDTLQDLLKDDKI